MSQEENKMIDEVEMSSVEEIRMDSIEEIKIGSQDEIGMNSVEEMDLDSVDEIDMDDVEEMEMKIENYENRIKLQDVLIESLGERCEEEKERNKLLHDRIIELNKELKKKQELEMVSDINYWRGIEKAHIELHDKYYKRIIQLEKQNFLLEVENDELKDELERIKNV